MSEEELSVGSLALDFVLPSNQGRQVALADYRGKALVVLFFVREYN